MPGRHFIITGGLVSAAANVTAARVRVRDVVAHADLGVLQAPFTLTVLVGGGGGNGEAVVLTPF
jgi:hypothetical protein